jgi:predicted nuclease of predicted toxin-antitoxin system
MKFKLDENLPVETALLLTAAGHDAHTVYQEDLCGAPDSKVSSVCRAEGRVLITLDTDFCNILNYPPAEYPGFIVLRLLDQSKPSVLHIMRQMVIPSLQKNIKGALWIVQKDGIRIR